MPTPHTTESPSVDRRTFWRASAGPSPGRSRVTVPDNGARTGHGVPGCERHRVHRRWDGADTDLRRALPQRLQDSARALPAERESGRDADRVRRVLVPRFDDHVPDDPYETTTDSAAAATAFASGVKTYNGAIGGVQTSGGGFQRVDTVLERASAQGTRPASSRRPRRHTPHPQRSRHTSRIAATRPRSRASTSKRPSRT